MTEIPLWVLLVIGTMLPLGVGLVVWLLIRDLSNPKDALSTKGERE